MRVQIPCDGHWLSRRILVFILPQIGGYLAARHIFFQIVPLVIYNSIKQPIAYEEQILTLQFFTPMP